MSTKRLAFLNSGGGGNLRFIAHCIEAEILIGYEIIGVFADRECEALGYSRSKGIPTIVSEYSLENATSLISALKTFSPDLVISSFHRILCGQILETYADQILNLHYSLIPAFAGNGMIGTKPVRLALERGCRIIGTTVHYVNESVDGGRIISQSCFSPRAGDDFCITMNRVFQSGCLNLLNAIMIHDKVAPTEHYSTETYGFFDPCALPESAVFNARFWEEIAQGK